MKISEANYAVAAYGTAGIHTIEKLFSFGVSPEQIYLYTYGADERNAPLVKYASANRLSCTRTRPFAVLLKPEIGIRNRNIDLIISAHYRDRIPGEVLAASRLGGINLHPSLLPKHRGTFSIPWALIDGDKNVGFTWHYMTPEFDKGNILVQASYPILPDATAFSLYHTILDVSFSALETALFYVMSGYGGIEQAQGGEYHKRELPFGGIIDPSWPDDKIDRFIRAMYFPPHEGAKAEIDGVVHEVMSMEQYRAIKK